VAGPMTAYITTNTVSVTDGNLDLDFTASVDQPKVSAIEILPGTVAPAPTAPAAPTGVTAAAAGTANTVSWTAVSGATGYFVERATAAAGPWTRLNTTAQTGTSFSDTAGATFVPTALYRVVATNAAGSSAPSATATVTRTATPAPQPVRINTGGGAVTVGGVTFAADTAFSGGKTFSNASVTGISRTTADALYVNERSATANGGGFSYDIPVANGTYTVRLHHAEIWFGATSGGPAGNGNRVFSANFEGGTTEVVNRDIFASVGSMAAYVTAHNVTVTGGNLDIDFTASVNQPSIAAIEVLPGANTTTAIPGGAPLGAAVVAPAQNNTPVPPGAPAAIQGVTPQAAKPTVTTPTVATPRVTVPTVTVPRVTMPGTLLTVTGQQPPTTIAVPEARTPEALAPEAVQLNAPVSVLDSLLPQAMALPRDVVAGQPDVVAAPREIRLFGKEGFAMRSDTLAGLLLLGLMLGLLAARRLGLFRWVASVGARLAPREAESRP
ncbi:MAG: hypothetical protein JWP66_252, partial [Naasia sp.]|nr:hypothetical protein [Naasia sp.]